MAEAGNVTVRIWLEDELTPALEWTTFELWESRAATKGGGLTREQMQGARIYHVWLSAERLARARARALISDTDR